jgi:hypothetical protein
MKIKQIILKKDSSKNFSEYLENFECNEKTIALIYFNENKEHWKNVIEEIQKVIPKTSIVGCSTAGHILDDLIYDKDLVITLMTFNKANFKAKLYENITAQNSIDSGKKIATDILDKNGSCFIISEGLNINGSKLVDGLNELKGEHHFFGGLSGDSTNFKETKVLFNGKFYSNSIVAIFFDQNIKIERIVGGGWKTFGVDRVVTKSENNIVYEIDHLPALDLYIEYLGEKHNLLPAYGLHFPLSLINEKGEMVTRTLLGINRENGSLTFAGDIPVNSKVKLMKATQDELIHASQNALNQLNTKTAQNNQDILIHEVSCVGRRIVLGQATEDECSYSSKNKNVFTTGFYSYGEISKANTTHETCLHNQTFTLTIIKEVE